MTQSGHAPRVARGPPSLLLRFCSRNKARQKIDMTAPVGIATPSVAIPMRAPVEVNTANNVLIMRFFMPSSHSTIIYLNRLIRGSGLLSLNQ